MGCDTEVGAVCINVWMLDSHCNPICPTNILHYPTTNIRMLFHHIHSEACNAVYIALHIVPLSEQLCSCQSLRVMGHDAARRSKPRRSARAAHLLLCMPSPPQRPDLDMASL